MTYREQQRQKVTSIRKAFFKDPGSIAETRCGYERDKIGSSLFGKQILGCAEFYLTKTAIIAIINQFLN